MEIRYSNYAPAAQQAAIRRLSRSQQRDLARYLATLDKRGPSAQPERESALRGLALLADETSDINPTQAATLARYLLAEKDEGEQAKSLSAAAAIKRWPAIAAGGGR